MQSGRRCWHKLGGLAIASLLLISPAHADPLTVKSSATTRPATQPVKPAVSPWKVDDKVEVKWGGTWFTAVVTNKRGGWHLITYEGNWKGWREWVEPWRIRKRGSKEDLLVSTDLGKSMMPGEKLIEPPAHPPGLPPAPFGATPPAHGPADGTATTGNTALENLTPVVHTDFSKLRELPIGPDGGAAVVPDPVPMPSRRIPEAPIALAGATGDFFEGVETILFANPKSPVAIVVTADVRPSAGTGSRVNRCDLMNNRLLGFSTLPMSLKFRDVSADGNQLLANSIAFGFGVSDRLDIWSIEATEPKHLVSFKPYDDKAGSARDIAWARFLTDDRIATLNSEGHLVVFDRTGKASWGAKIDQNIAPAVSGGGKYLAVGWAEGAAILNAATGKTVRLLRGASLGYAVLSFKPDGTQVAAAASDLLIVWDIDNPQPVQELSPIGCAGLQIDWAGDEFILLDGAHLVGLKQKVVVWNFARDTENKGGGQNGSSSFGGRYWYESSRGGGTKPVLVSVVLPGEKLKAAVAQLKLEAQMHVAPGTRVSLEVNLPEEIRDKVMTALKARLTANGIVLADGQPIRLVASTEQGKSRDISYRTMGGPQFGPNAKAATTITANELISRLQFIGADGKPLWERSAVTPPPTFVNLREGQTVEQAVADAVTPRAGFFETARIPKHIPKEPVPGAMRQSRLTAAGTIAEK